MEPATQKPTDDPASVLQNCVVPENIHTPITEGIGNSKGEGGGVKDPGNWGCMIGLISRGIPEVLSLRTQTYFRLSLVPPSDSQK